MSVIYLEAQRSKYDRPSRWATPAGLPPFTDLLFVIFRGLGDSRGSLIVRHFAIAAEGLAPLEAVGAADTIKAARSLIPPGSARVYGWGRRHPSIIELWTPPHCLRTAANRP